MCHVSVPWLKFMIRLCFKKKRMFTDFGVTVLKTFRCCCLVRRRGGEELEARGRPARARHHRGDEGSHEAARAEQHRPLRAHPVSTRTRASTRTLFQLVSFTLCVYVFDPVLCTRTRLLHTKLHVCTHAQHSTTNIFYGQLTPDTLPLIIFRCISRTCKIKVCHTYMYMYVRCRICM